MAPWQYRRRMFQSKKKKCWSEAGSLGLRERVLIREHFDKALVIASLSEVVHSMERSRVLVRMRNHSVLFAMPTFSTSLLEVKLFLPNYRKCVISSSLCSM